MNNNWRMNEYRFLSSVLNTFFVSNGDSHALSPPLSPGLLIIFLFDLHGEGKLIQIFKKIKKKNKNRFSVFDIVLHTRACSLFSNFKLRERVITKKS